MPCSTRYFITLFDRSSESFMFMSLAPRLSVWPSIETFLIDGVAFSSRPTSSRIGKLTGLIVALPVSNSIFFRIWISFEPSTRRMNCGHPFCFGSFDG